MAKQSGEKPNAILVRNAVRLPASQKSLPVLQLTY
jgi:hypothetical protein